MAVNERDMSMWEREYFLMLTADLLGEGSARSVYVHRANDQMVVKIEQGGRSFQNIREYETWRAARGGPLEKWLAPCIDISPCGGVLVQARTRPLSPPEWPTSLPSCLTDIKPENFGWLEDRVVSHDYGIIIPEFSMKRRRVSWG